MEEEEEPTCPLEQSQQAALIAVNSDLNAMYRWILGVLVTVNAGGLLALVSMSDKISLDAISFAGRAFVAGTALAIMCGVSSATRANVTIGAVVERGCANARFSSIWANLNFTFGVFSLVLWIFGVWRASDLSGFCAP